MSVIVAIKENGRVYLGADCRVTDNGLIAPVSEDNYKIAKIKGTNHALFGSVGELVDWNFVKYKYCVPQGIDNIDMEFLQCEFVPTIYQILKNAGFVSNSDDGRAKIDSPFMFAIKDKIYSTDNDLAIVSHDDYFAIGSGQSVALGSLASSKGRPAKTRILMAIAAASVVRDTVGLPMVISDTETCEFEKYTEEDVIKILGNDCIFRGSKILN